LCATRCVDTKNLSDCPSVEGSLSGRTVATRCLSKRQELLPRSRYDFLPCCVCVWVCVCALVRFPQARLRVGWHGADGQQLQSLIMRSDSFTSNMRTSPFINIRDFDKVRPLCIALVFLPSQRQLSHDLYNPQESHPQSGDIVQFEPRPGDVWYGYCLTGEVESRYLREDDPEEAIQIRVDTLALPCCCHCTAYSGQSFHYST
jgi:hypothetical protein